MGRFKIIKYYSLLLPITIFLALSSTGLRGDTLILKDGTVMVGKIRVKTSKSVIFKNYYGVFRVKKRLIRKAYITKKYTTDIAIHKKLGRNYDVKAIKKADIRHCQQAGGER